MIRPGKDYVHQRKNGAEKPFGLAYGQVKQQSKRKGSLDGHIRINLLPTAFSGSRRCPGLDGLLTQPQRDVTLISQRLIILWPVFDTISSFVFGMSIGTFMGLGHGHQR